ncbi:BamA/TamA family outer membrane protein [Mangrovibacterium lignilyticum]|uniref:BamA/TamA family outer membrane protein n=1 Tax=Mangrovibacterium lignilyticum TaxID=2668052 RepID=UPI0013D5E8F5|nr:BamA/TamA family outer membrane protein [Mangrovibacterium lignilyticum]
MQKYTLPLLLLFCSSLVFAQEQATDSIGSSSLKPEKNIDFSVMPFLSYNRNLDFMFGAIPMMMYRLDPNDVVSPKSLSGVSAVYTTNGSYFIGFFNKLHFAEDKWRAKLFAVTGDHYSQFFMNDTDIPGFYEYGTNTIYISVGIQRKITKGLYGGIGYNYAHHKTNYEDDIQAPSTTKNNGIEYSVHYDTRNAVYYPTTGNNVKLKWTSFPKWFGNEVEANKISTEYNHYFPMRSGTDVLATRLSGTFGLGDISFEQQVTIGGKDIRGYSEGKYRGDGLMAIQGEYRYNFNGKMGLVGFAGLATIYGSDNKSFNGSLYPGAGVGYRYQAFKAVKFNIGLDAAVGKDDWGIYFRIGEAF